MSIVATSPFELGKYIHKRLILPVSPSVLVKIAQWSKMKGKLVGCYAHFLLLVFGLSGANSVSLNDKEIIESIHNSLRAIVQPEAADMQYMVREIFNFKTS